MARSRNKAFFAIMLIIPVAFTELSLQAYYRVANGAFLFERMALPIYSADEHRFYKVKANLDYRHRTNEYDVTYYTNSQGLRTDHQRKEIRVEKRGNTFRILFLGPSFTFGWANDYENAYASIIAENITNHGKDVEIMNLGTPAQPIGHQLCWLKESGFGFSPDLIVQTVYGDPGGVPADCREPLNKPFVRDGRLYTSDPGLGKRLFKAAKNSAIVFYGWYFRQAVISDSDPERGLGEELYDDDGKDSIEGERDIRPDTYEEYISFARSVLKRDIPVVFLHIPYSYVVRPADLSRWSHGGRTDPRALKRSARELELLLAERGVPFVNPVGELIAGDKKERMYYFLDTHLTPSGNRVIANQATPVINNVISTAANGIDNQYGSE